jgi:hypothetical protein
MSISVTVTVVAISLPPPQVPVWTGLPRNPESVARALLISLRVCSVSIHEAFESIWKHLEASLSSASRNPESVALALLISLSSVLSAFRKQAFGSSLSSASRKSARIQRESTNQPISLILSLCSHQFSQSHWHGMALLPRRDSQLVVLSVGLWLWPGRSRLQVLRLRVNCNFPIATSNTIKCLSEWEGVAMGGETQANLALSDSRVMRRNSLSCLITSDRVQVNHRRFEMRGWASHRVRDAGAEAHIYIDAHGPQSMVHGGVGVRPDSRWRLTVLDLHYVLIYLHQVVCTILEGEFPRDCVNRAPTPDSN